MNAAQLVEQFRLQVADEATPYLWSDSEVYQYADNAQKLFCRLTWGIADATSALTQVSYSAGDTFATYDPRINKLRAVRRADGTEVDVINIEDLGRTGIGTDYGSPRRYVLDSLTGPVNAVVVGMEMNKFRLIHIPDEDGQLSLIVYRNPIETLVESSPAMELEIDEQHHWYLLEGMRMFAFKKEDAETFDRGRAQESETSFRGYCEEVRQERERREHKKRLIDYGGI